MLWPLISIIITSYNYGHTIRTALSSACCQDYPNIEILILDNASTDNTAAILEDYQHNARIRIFYNGENIGAQANHNRGLGEARGDYILFLSADDMLYPSSILEAYLCFLAQPEVDLVYSPTHIMNDEGQLLYRIIITGEILGGYRGYRDEFPYLLMNNYIGFASILAPRWVYEKYGGINENIVALDFDLLLRWSAAGLRFAYLPRARHAYRIHDNQESGLNKFSRSGLSILERIAMIRAHMSTSDISRIDGYEHRIARSLSEQFERCQKVGLQKPEVIAGEVQRLQDDLSIVCDQNRQRPFIPKISLLIIPYEPLSAFLESLQSLLAQSLQDWEAIVICQPGIDLMPFCQHLDPRGRMRTLQLLNAMPYGQALNQGLRLATGNSITCLRAGISTFARDHLQCLSDSLKRESQAVCVAQARLMVLDSSGYPTPIQNVFIQNNVAERICFAPSQPVEAITFTRRMIDQAGYYSEELIHWADWDLLLRLSQSFPINVISSEVMIYALPGAKPMDGGHALYLDILNRIYAQYSTQSPKLLACRAQYRKLLSQLSESPKNEEHPFDFTMQQFQQFMGAPIAV